MNRNQIFTTLELIDGQIRLTVGEFFNSNFYIYDVFTSSSKGLVGEQIVDEKEVIDTLNSLLALARRKIEIDINSVSLCLPSYSITISERTATSPVNGKNSLITQTDIDNAIRIAYKSRVEEGQEIIEVIPIDFTVDNDETHNFVPLGYRSSTFKIRYNLLTLPKELINAYKRIIKACNLKVEYQFLDTICLYEGAFSEDDLDIAVLDLSRFTTRLNIYRKGRLLKYISLGEGVESIIKEVATTYNMELAQARELVLVNGNARSELASDYSIYKSEINGRVSYLSERELSKIIEAKLNALLEQVLSETNNLLFKDKFEVVICGYGSEIKNLDAKFYQLAKVETSVAKSNVLGITKANNIQTYGLIKLTYNNLGQKGYKNLQIENENDIITNEGNKEKEFSNFDTLTLNEDDL